MPNTPPTPVEEVVVVVKLLQDILFRLGVILFANVLISVMLLFAIYAIEDI